MACLGGPEHLRKRFWSSQKTSEWSANAGSQNHSDQMTAATYHSEDFGRIGQLRLLQRDQVAEDFVRTLCCDPSCVY
jgi:hypothetical protein